MNLEYVLVNNLLKHLIQVLYQISEVYKEVIYFQKAYKLDKKLNKLNE